MGQTLSLPFKLVSTTLTFYRGFFHYLCGKGRSARYLPPHLHPAEESSVPAYLRPAPPLLTNTVSEVELKKDGRLFTTRSSVFYQHARVHLFTLASEFYLYNKPHYRKGTYGEDMVDNFANVAIPGMGISLSYFVRNRICAFALATCIYPAVSLAAAVHLWIVTRGASSISDEYAIRLLAPDDWFSYWRLNSRIAALHAYLNNVPMGYTMENKWTFLERGSECDVPVSPYLNCPDIVVKHRNEEGGLGIYFYKNATSGGDWIIQERISNGPWVREHLPINAPLSTFRVITQSRGALNVVGNSEEGGGGGGCKLDDITALSCVFRAGREGAKTDHVSVLFDVDVATGVVLGGTTNEHWYNLSLLSCLNPFKRTMWRSKDHDVTHHPDGNIPITGEVVPNIREMLQLVETSHLKLCPDVPLVGWDVVLSADPKLPVCLLEVNLSCNFFRGSFDRKVYLDFLEDMIVNMQDMRLKAEERK